MPIALNASLFLPQAVSLRPSAMFDVPPSRIIPMERFRMVAIADSIVAPRVKIRFLNRCRTNHSSILLGHLKKMGGD
jgi:hypothetical protein